MLTVSFSSTDYVGHNFGVNSKTTTQMISNYSGNVGAKYNANFSKNILSKEFILMLKNGSKWL